MRFKSIAFVISKPWEFCRDQVEALQLVDDRKLVRAVNQLQKMGGGGGGVKMIWRNSISRKDEKSVNAPIGLTCLLITSSG